MKVQVKVQWFLGNTRCHELPPAAVPAEMHDRHFSHTKADMKRQADPGGTARIAPTYKQRVELVQQERVTASAYVQQVQ